MQSSNSSYIEHHEGDRVRIRNGEYKRKRGVIQSVEKKQIEVQLEEGNIVSVAPQDITNFSLAARKAWQTMRT